MRVQCSRGLDVFVLRLRSVTSANGFMPTTAKVRYSLTIALTLSLTLLTPSLLILTLNCTDSNP